MPRRHGCPADNRHSPTCAVTVPKLGTTNGLVSPIKTTVFEAKLRSLWTNGFRNSGFSEAVREYMPFPKRRSENNGKWYNIYNHVHVYLRACVPIITLKTLFQTTGKTSENRGKEEALSLEYTGILLQTQTKGVDCHDNRSTDQDPRSCCCGCPSSSRRKDPPQSLLTRNFD